MEDEPVLDKPPELLALHTVSAELFTTLRSWFDVPPTLTLDLVEIDSAVAELGDPEVIIAMAMRKLQALQLISTPGVLTSTDVVIAIVNDLDRALLQAPSMYLERKAGSTDWDQAFADLEGVASLEIAPEAGDAVDPEIELFEAHHSALHDAVHAVVDAAEGEIRFFE